MRILAKIILVISKIRRRLLMLLYKSLFKKIGANLNFDPYGTYTFRNISIGNDVYIGPGSVMYAEDAEIILGNKILIGPNVTLITGDHNYLVPGQYMYDVKIKLPENDLPIEIQDDVWIGSGVTILKGVTIGVGSIIAAGSVVTKNIPPNSIAVGIPARVIKERFNPDTFQEHLQALKNSNF